MTATRVIGHKTNNGWMNAKWVVGHKTNNGWMNAKWVVGHKTNNGWNYFMQSGLSVIRPTTAAKFATHLLCK